MTEVGGPVPPDAYAARTCTNHPPGRDRCGKPGIYHGLAWLDVTDEPVASLVACAAHLPDMAELCFSVHDIGGDCCMPGTVYRWFTNPATGDVVSWCEFEDGQPAEVVVDAVVVLVP